VTSGLGNYFVILIIAALTVLLTLLLSRSRLGSAFIAVRDDAVLASARGLWPTRLRLTAFALSAAITSVAGVFAAHFQHVVCPTQGDLAVTILLLVMVFIGGRASLRGVVVAAIAFTLIPQILRMADEWRLVIFGVLLLASVTTLPGGLESIFDAVGRRLGSFATNGRPSSSTEEVHGER
jgi:ABC-type branched-subunit amino acid transport system permease subunit